MAAGRGGQGAFTFAGAQWNSLDPMLVAYLLANQGAARYLVATPTSGYTSVYAAPAGAAVEGGDPARSGGGQDATTDLAAWVRSSCAAVPTELWRTSPTDATATPGAGQTPIAPGGPSRGPGGGPGLPSQQLYDCAVR